MNEDIHSILRTWTKKTILLRWILKTVKTTMKAGTTELRTVVLFGLNDRSQGRRTLAKDDQNSPTDYQTNKSHTRRQERIHTSRFHDPIVHHSIFKP